MNKLTKCRFVICLAVTLSLLSITATVVADGITVGSLRCEYRENPLGIDVLAPRLFWKLKAPGRRAVNQTAYQILVASSEDLLEQDTGDLWDSGKTLSDQSIQIEYAGRPLQSRMYCYWKVRVWDNNGQVSAWSEPAMWSMGLLGPADWRASWIGYDAAYQQSPEQAANDKLLNIQGLKWVQMPGKIGRDSVDTYLRRRVEIPAGRKIRRAVLACYAFHSCEAAVNGSAIGQAAHWEQTARLDATKFFRNGANIVTMVVSQTDPHRPAVIGRLVVQFETGDNLIIPIDQTWKITQEPGAGWQEIDYDDSTWATPELGGQPWKGPAPVSDLARVPAPYLRKDFKVDQPIRRAIVYVTALGTYELRLNGRRVSQDVLAPGWTEFRKRVHYQTYDVTSQVVKGDNTIGAILGDGWYASDLAHLARRNYYGGKPRLLTQLVIELADGTTQVVTSDPDWRAAYGPIRHADLLIGCEYDARLEMPGWDRPGFNDNDWQPVVCTQSSSAPGSGVSDVTALLRGAIADGHLAIKVDNDSLGGDPAYGSVKSLTIVYSQNGKEQKQRFAENSDVNLGSADQPVQILSALYGIEKETGLQVQASVTEPSRPIDELPALKLTEPRPGCWTFDLGQNMVGWVRLKVRGAAGQRITVRHAEMLNADGTVYTAALRSCPATDFYILSGDSEETLEPYFTFHGFRYVEVRGLTSKPSLDAVTGIVVHTPMHRTGHFECSYPLLNQLYSNIIWGQKGNYLEIPTDCPQRDERMGWTGDTQFFVTTAAYNFDVAAFFSRWLQTCEDDQKPDGSFPHVVPDIMGGGGATAWGDAALLCTYRIYRTYDDTRLVAERFDAMERYMKWLDGKTKNGISHVGGFGDWLNAGGNAPAPVIDTAYHAYLAQIMSEMAAAIGRDDDARRYAQLHDQVKAAFIREFLESDGSLKGSSQTGYALAFTMNLLPADMRAKAAEKFVGEIERFDWHLATGFIGTPRLLPALSAAGRDDVAYRLLLTDTYPSWLFPVKNGATTMWERWNGWTPDRGFGNVSMNSFNHYAFGAVGEYLYGGVGGIRASSPGYKTITIKPAIGEGLTWAKTSFDSPYGTIVSNWNLEGSKLTMDVSIPPCTTATVYVPAKDPSEVTENGKPVGDAEGVKFLRMQNGAAVYTVGSGSYRFGSVMDN